MTNEKLIADWGRAESAGLVRLRAEHEQENYFDVWGLPDQKRTWGGFLGERLRHRGTV